MRDDEPTTTEIETTIKVIDFFARHPEKYDETTMRPLRVSVQKIVKRELAKYFGGQTLREYVKGRFQKKHMKHKRQKKEEDRQKMDRCMLRAVRIKRRNSLIAQARMTSANHHHQTTLMIPDGPARVYMELDAAPIPTESQTEQEETLHRSRLCYICKERYQHLHHFYDSLCPKCAEINWTKRHQSADLTGKVALVTGCRTKIGFETALKLLRAGAKVIGTTRFPFDAAQRYSKETDFASWQNRLFIYGLDFQQIGSVERFCQFLLTQEDHLDILINNAAQTVFRPPEYYKFVLDFRPDLVEKLEENVKKIVYCGKSEAGNPAMSLENNTVAIHLDSKEDSKEQMSSKLTLSVSKVDENKADSLLDASGHVLDVRPTNSWMHRLGEVDTGELVQVLAINTVAPFVLCSKLRPLLQRNREQRGPGFIINVSAMEGKFHRFKRPTHPHTNMAKAALNMLTKTCASDLVLHGVYMNSVDTGWVNDERPLPLAARLAREQHFQTPLDEVDGAARILDPIFDGSNCYGLFLKDYAPTDW